MAVTLKDIAKATGLSISTVSRVASGKGYVSTDARERAEAAMAELGYEHRTQRRRFVSDSSDQVLIMIGGVRSSIAANYVELLSDELFAKGKQPIVGVTGFSAEREVEYLNMAADRHFFGVITLTLTETPSVVRLLKHYSCPIVMLGRYLPMRRVDCLHPDYYKMGFDAAEYLISRGHERIAFVGATKTSTISQDKHTGFIDCMHSHGLEVRPDFELYARRMDYGDAEDVARRIIELHERPTALISSNDISVGILDLLLAEGMRVPEDLSIFTCEDSPMVRHCQVPMTAMDVDYQQMCVDAVRTLSRRRRHPDEAFIRMYYDPTIIERESILDISAQPLK